MPRWLGTAEAVLETRRAIQHFIHSNAEFIGFGTTRICFAEDEHRVIKIAYSMLGTIASDAEVDSYENFVEIPKDRYDKFDPEDERIPTAECRFLDFGYSHIKLLSMERIWNFPKAGEKLPSWTQLVYGSQVGYNSRGQLVAYDL